MQKIQYVIFLILMTLSSSQLQAAPIYSNFKSYDGLNIRTAKWEAKGKKRGTFFFLQGMGGFIEAYTDFAQRLNDLGFDVFTLDWRGQGGSDRQTTKSTLLHVNSFDDYVKDLETFLSMQKDFARPVIVVGNSMGGHIALRYISDHPKAVDGMITMSPMVDINTEPYPYYFARALAVAANTVGATEHFVLGYDTFTYDRCVTHFSETKFGDKEKYIQDCEFLKDKPTLATGGPSFGWLYSAFESCDLVTNENFGTKISIPVLMVTVPHDTLVDTDSQRDLCARMPKCRQVFYQDGHHNLLKDHNNLVDRVVHDIDRFIKDLPSLQKGTPQAELVMADNFG